MTLVQLNNITKTFNDKDVLCQVNARIFPGEHIGLVGVNGTGKTTLFKIILGIMAEDSGEIARRKELVIAYLPQIPEIDEQATLREAALQGRRDLQQIERRLDQLQQQLSSANKQQMAALIEEQDRLLIRFEQSGGYRYRADTEAVLHGLGFSDHSFEQKVGQLSGGQKNRLALVQALLKESDLLLLDEPTNFLDIESSEWLERYLQELSTAILVVSHDRYFLNQVTTTTWEITAGQLSCWSGNYDKFQQLKQLQQEQQQKQYESQQEEIRRQQDFIRRNIYGQKHRQAQSRRKLLEKMEKAAAPHQEKAINIAIHTKEPRVSKVLEVNNISHAFGERLLFSALDFSLNSGEKMAVLGPNGCGKSTLLHIIVGKLAPTQGMVSIGAKVRIGFYHQELHDLVPEDNAFDTIKNLVPALDDLPVRNFLARFLFCGDDIYRPVACLSGGEKSRLALARLLIMQPNFLVLDEPTNHLDINSRQALESALQDYNGTVLFVSHDRYFIDQIAERILYYHQKSWLNFYGNYSQFAASKQHLLPEKLPPPTPAVEKKRPPTTTPAPSKKEKTLYSGRLGKHDYRFGNPA